MNMDKAIELLKEKGYKLTDKRRDMLAFFLQSDGYRTAKELNEYMEKRYAGVSFDTVYRNLHLFTEMGILEATELEGEKHFQIACSMHHHHHFICKTCGKTKEIDLCPMEDLGKRLGGFLIQDHKFEVYGICPACQAS